jgi:hypothetical protein
MSYFSDTERPIDEKKLPDGTFYMIIKKQTKLKKGGKRYGKNE